MNNLVTFESRPGARLRLFCFPHAGGGASVYRRWPKALPDDIEVVAIQLPGRENRISDKSPDTFKALAVETALSVIDRSDKPFIFFGHSMGGLLCYEVAQILGNRDHIRNLRKLIISGTRAPHSRGEDPPIHQLPDPEFIRELRKLNGISNEVLQHEDLLQLVLPTIRDDFRLIENYVHIPQLPMHMPLTVYGGLEDDIQQTHLEEWRGYTASSFDLRMFPGDHFFIHSTFPTISESLRMDL